VLDLPSRGGVLHVDKLMNILQYVNGYLKAANRNNIKVTRVMDTRLTFRMESRRYGPRFTRACNAISWLPFVRRGSGSKHVRHKHGRRVVRVCYHRETPKQTMSRVGPK